MNIARHLATSLRSLGPALAELLESLALLTGGALISYGAWEVYEPAGPITGGILLIAGCLLRARGIG